MKIRKNKLTLKKDEHNNVINPLVVGNVYKVVGKINKKTNYLWFVISPSQLLILGASREEDERFIGKILPMLTQDMLLMMMQTNGFNVYLLEA